MYVCTVHRTEYTAFVLLIQSMPISMYVCILLNVNRQKARTLLLYFYFIYICIYVCEYPYIGFIPWEVKQMKAFGDSIHFFEGS